MPHHGREVMHFSGHNGAGETATFTALVLNVGVCERVLTMCVDWLRRCRGYLVSEYLNVLHIGVETGCVFWGGPGRLCMAHRP